MNGVDVNNKWVATNLITINMPDGRKAQSMSVCNIIIPGLPTKPIGHVVPHSAVASFIGFCLICKAGCQVMFDSKKIDVIFNGKVILRGYKNPSTDLLTLPTNTKKMWSALS